LAKPGVHRRKNEVLIYKESAKSKDDVMTMEENQEEISYRPKKFKHVLGKSIL